MLAYLDNPQIKVDILAQLEAHKAADQIVKGQYWQSGKGCAVGCTIHSDDHMEYEGRFGIPVMLARLEDTIFEGLPNGTAKAWPLRFMGAIRPGADLSLVGWRFQHWLLTDERVNPGISHPLVRDAVKACADVLAPLMNGKPVGQWAAWSAAESARLAAQSAVSAVSAGWSAQSAQSAVSAWAAGWSAQSAESAAAAESAAWSARSAAAESAESAAWSAASAARSAASAARSAAAAAWSAASAYALMADKLIELIEAAP